LLSDCRYIDAHDGRKEDEPNPSVPVPELTRGPGWPSSSLGSKQMRLSTIEGVSAVMRVSFGVGFAVMRVSSGMFRSSEPSSLIISRRPVADQRIHSTHPPNHALDASDSFKESPALREVFLLATRLSNCE
jgi:hypothetical protein